MPGATLASIDANDIESMTVLKDGSGAAIYGTRGSSGVILITSKKGTSGPMQVSYSTSFAQTSISQEIPVLSAAEFRANGGTDLGTETDWVDAITRNGSNVVHNFSVSGGGEKSTYRMSANLRRSEGILNRTGFDQMNTRAALNTKAINDKLDLHLIYLTQNLTANLVMKEHLNLLNFTIQLLLYLLTILMQDFKLVLHNLEDILSS